MRDGEPLTVTIVIFALDDEGTEIHRHDTVYWFTTNSQDWIRDRLIPWAMDQGYGVEITPYDPEKEENAIDGEIIAEYPNPVSSH